MNFDMNSKEENKDLIDALKYSSDILIKLTEKISDHENEIFELNKNLNSINDIIITIKNQMDLIKNIIKMYKDKNKNIKYPEVNEQHNQSFLKSEISNNIINDKLNNKNIDDKNKIDKIINSIIKRKNDLDNNYLELKNNININNDQENNIINNNQNKNNLYSNSILKNRKKINSVKRF